MDHATAQYIRRTLSRIGWAVLLYLLAAQLLGGLCAFIPGAAENIYLSTLLSYAVCYGIAPAVLWLMIRSLPTGRRQALSLSPRAFARTAVYCVGILYLFNLLTGLLMLAVELASGASTSNLLQATMDAMPTWLYLVLVGIIAPLGEEFVFRGLLLSRLRPFGDRCAIWFSAVAFGLFHLNLYQFFYATAAGLIFAGIALKTGKLRYTIALHAIVNLTSAAFTLVTGISDLAAGVAGVVILALIALAIYLFVRYAPTFRHLPPQLPAAEGEVMRSLLRAPGVWVCTLLALAVSVAIIFLV